MIISIIVVVAVSRRCNKGVNIVDTESIDPENKKPESRGPILITSFRPWRVHQHSNSSHDLVASLSKSRQLPTDTVWLPAVPVSFELAPIRVIGEISRLRPRLVICCGMAEKRQRLSIEKQATGKTTLQTSINVSKLLGYTLISEISEDAGRYVCNHLYHSVLEFIEYAQWPIRGLFVHVPVLDIHNKVLVLSDFVNIVNRIDDCSQVRTPK